MIIQKIKYKLKYFRRFLFRNILGICEKDGSFLNYDRNGRGLCPLCGK